VQTSLKLVNLEVELEGFVSARRERKQDVGFIGVVVMKRALFWLVLLLGFAFPVLAKQHPVPLEVKTDPAKCLECHEDKSKGAHVHTAISMGCTTCHEIRRIKEITRVKLTTATPVKLCLSCHADKNAAEAKGRVHRPAVRDCVKCHDPHQSANEKQLVKPASGGKDENLCLSCHKIGLDVPQKGSRHAAVDMGCGTCHVTHKVGDPGKREFRQHLTKDAPALCLDCHDGKDAKLSQAHSNQPFAKADCLTCHDPHQSRSPKLMQAFVHSPFEGGKDSCGTCHAPAKDGKVVLTQASSKELCLTCHSDKKDLIEKAKVQHPGAAGDCTDCHSPHAGKTQGFPKPDAVNVCLSCHSDQAEQGKKKHLHQPVFQQGCFTCHEPHGGDNPKLLRASTTSGLCLECHSPDTKPEPVKDAPLVTIFGGKVRLPDTYFRQVVRLPIKYGLGHPVDKHPVKDQMDPNDISKVRVVINCSTCHQPHASAEAGLLVKDQSNSMAFCANCHKDLGK